MTSLPCGQTIKRWRTHRHLTQAALARKAKLPRPNLSAIEQGRRDLSLRTLRRLADALEVRPGLLADGVPPAPLAGEPLSSGRAALERVADAAAFSHPVTDPREQLAAAALGLLVGPRTRALHRHWRPSRISRRKALHAWMTLNSLYSRGAIHTLIERITERQRTHAAPAH